MFIQGDLLSILQLGTGLFWIITYILIIIRGFLDKSYGMPMAALCANIAWEFIYTFVFPHSGPQKIITLIWFLLDVIILMQYLLYGPKEKKKGISERYFYSSFFITLVFSFLIIMAMAFEFNDIEGKYAAFGQNLMMSGLFISLLLSRENRSGQSISIAIFKMLGSLCAAIAFYIYFRTSLITILSIATLVYDLIYILLLRKFYRRKR
ncbi:hypothetical protein [Rummeliibacillus sp. TYF005]|uniref:transmembrane-type terpene cyclase n=1 Tax=Rummeliibacillus sp. TYF005 TaxID=2058214 RepID=UPI000F51F735|nr:hypothetical protein [Rummeliibacillus sp. TYF005]RPJ96084.1 hypothetical protein CW357_06955 [Rummeliibacillus sp. TYF005]